jgi:hypothetical protein
MAKELEIRPELLFSHLPLTQNQGRRILYPIEPDKMQGTQDPKSEVYLACPGLERVMHEDRTKSLKRALEHVWKNLDPSAAIFKRFPFDPTQPLIPVPRRGKDGKFV